MSFVSRRQFLSTGVVIGATVSLSMSSLRATAANDVVHLGFIGCGGRASNLLTAFSAIPGVVVIGLCDPDESRLGAAGDRFPKAQRWRDLCGMLDDQSIDAAVISTCNHWHCLAAIWAMEAGKDVFVEKPLSHSQWEGQQTVAAARKFGRVCQLGTQQRSDPMQGEIKTFLHDEHALGKL
ncbi:MAG: Gfo/Idh/MocA family oxidoreductase [Pirellulaceae bacterium]|nr:Gfo/Idh/MocA family oxidoreductase [Pirellulaceae bacterium]